MIKARHILKLLNTQSNIKRMPERFEDRYSDFQQDIIMLLKQSGLANKNNKPDGLINFISLIAGRRSGKTTLCASLPAFIESTFPDWQGNYTFAGFDLKYLKQLYWNEVLNYLDFYKIKYKTNSKDSDITLNRSRNTIFFESLKDLASAQKTLGKKVKLAVIDEAQNIRQDILKTTCETFIEPSLMDTGGCLFNIGTPPMVHKSSYFLKKHKKCSHAFDGINVYNNKFVSKNLADAFLNNKRKEYGLIKGKEDTNFRRQFLGELVEDRESLVFPLTEGHIYDKLPQPLSQLDYYSAGGIDIGFNDKDAFAVLLYYPKARCVFVDYEFEKSQQLTSDFSKVIREVKGRYPMNVELVGDSGGGGLKTIKDMESQEGLFISRAKKTDKLSNIHFLRNLIRENRFFVKRDSIFYRESDLIGWNEDQTKIDDKVYHSDILDAILYAVRYIKTHFM